jgi:hypothetical protein
MSDRLTPQETARYIRNMRQIEYQACSSHLLSLDILNRPGEATNDEVRQATVQSLEELVQTVDKLDVITQVSCPCVVLGAENCIREES